MALEGFMLVPSMFPSWLRWTYIVPFHTYVFRSLMFNEFHGDALGEKVLQSYDIDMPSIGQDMVVIFCYGLVSLTACVCLNVSFFVKSNEIYHRQSTSSPR